MYTNRLIKTSVRCQEFQITNIKQQITSEIILNSFIDSHFFFWAQIWIFTSKALNKGIDSTHERSLTLIFHHRIINYGSFPSKMKKKITNAEYTLY